MADMSGAEPLGSTTVITLYPTGIHCADCARDMIDGTLKARPGIVDASFEPSSGALSVEYIPNRVGENEIRAVVSEMGYGLGARPVKTSSAREVGNVVAVALVVIALVLFVVLMRSVAG